MLVPPDAPEGAGGLAGVKGWLDDGDPFLAAVDAIVAARSSHVPRTWARGSSRRAKGRP